MSDEATITALPCWRGRVTMTPLSGGLSNRIWLVTDAKGRHVVRLGRDFPFHHVDRAREAMAARAAHAAGFGPGVSYAADGVMVTDYIDALALTANAVRAIPDRIGVLLRDFHRDMPARITGPGFIFWPFHVIRDYAAQLREYGTPGLDRYLALATALETAQVPLPVVFGHHDLLPANLLDDGARLWLIDYEYAGFGTAMFDLAGVASNAGMTADEAGTLLVTYLGRAADPAFRCAFDAMQCASLLREAMWSMVSALHLATPGVDFAAYAQENLARLDTALEIYQTLHGKLTV
ncbi:MAG: phosphotransferase [Paracoccaceae bacterium]